LPAVPAHLLKKGARHVLLATRMTEEFINATSDELIGAAERASSVQPSRRVQAGVQHFAGDVRRACLRTISRSSAGRQWNRTRSYQRSSGATHGLFISRHRVEIVAASRTATHRSARSCRGSGHRHKSEVIFRYRARVRPRRRHNQPQLTNPNSRKSLREELHEIRTSAVRGPVRGR